MEHTLADEIQPYVADHVRVRRLMVRALELVDTLHTAGVVHANLHPRNILVRDDDLVSLRDERFPADEYDAPEGPHTFASNIYSMGVILRALYANRPNLGRDALALIARATNAEPAARFPTIRAMRDTLAALGMPARAHGRWLKAFETTEARERELLAASRTDPDARLVYADWLEQRGLDHRAKFARDETPGPAEDATWRALIARAPVLGCYQQACPKRWDLLELLPFDNIRHCPGCKLPVYYCASVEAIVAQQGQPVALDATIDQQAAFLAHMVTPRYTPVPPPEIVVTSDQTYSGPLTGNLLTRLWSRLLRR
ncbi:MAG: TIGR02996 domain-containing protein [Myxococcota bacterium]|nr:TIGR02996 domain-containing protein [Myxococcota bacterium]